MQLCRASGTNLPLNDAVSDVTVCWGVLHHMDDPERALSELKRITKPCGEALIFIYSDAYSDRENLNRFVKCIPDEKKYTLIKNTSDYLDTWREVDKFYADLLSQNIFMSVKHSREWQIFQWYDGITPTFHHQLETQLSSLAKRAGFLKTVNMSSPGCYKLFC